MEEIERDGIKDADFIEIKDAFIPKEYFHAPIQKNGDKDLIIFPIRSKVDDKTPIKIIAWQQKKDPTCIEQKNCLETGVKTVRGVIRPMKKRRDLTNQIILSRDEKLNSSIIYMEIDQTPMAWYWHLLVLVLTAGGIVLVEMKRK